MRKDYEPVATVMELDGQPLITHDDRLLLRAQKHELGLWSNWKAGTRITWKDGSPVVLSWHHVEDVRKTRRTAPPPEHEHLWRPQYERTVPLEGVRVRLSYNQVDVELLNLQNDLRSRYRIALETLAGMEKAGVVSYRPRSSEPTPRNIQEALRHRMRRYAKVTEYEHNLLFRGALGRRMFQALRPHDRAPEPFEGTVYLKGFNRYVGLQVSQKFYNVSRRESRADTEEEELWKLETLFRKEYFKAHNLRDVSQFVEQPDIQEHLLEVLTKRLTSVLRCVEDGGVGMAQFELGLCERATARDTAQAILRRELTLTERVEALERKTREHDNRLEKLERHLNR